MQPFTHNANTFSQLTSKVNHVSQTTHKHTPTHKTHCNTSGLNTHVCIHYIYIAVKLRPSTLGGSLRHYSCGKYKHQTWVGPQDTTPMQSTKHFQNISKKPATIQSLTTHPGLLFQRWRTQTVESSLQSKLSLV